MTYLGVKGGWAVRIFTKGTGVVATRKTTGTAGASRRKTTAKPAAKPQDAKSGPVVLDPPKPTAATAAKKPQTIDAKAVDVTKADDNPAKVSDSVNKTDTDKPVEKPEPVKTKADPTPPQPKSASRAGLIVAMIVGGAVAGGIGYYAGRANMPASAPDQTAEIQQLNTRLSDRITTLEQQIAELAAVEKAPDNSGLQADFENLKTALAGKTNDLSDRLGVTEVQLKDALARLDAAQAKLAERLSVSGGQLSDTASELVAGYGAEIEDLKTRLEDQLKANSELSKKIDAVSQAATTQLTEAREKVAALTESAVETVKTADVSVAVTRLQAAFDTGKSYADQLAKIAKDAAVDIPDALLKPADQGVVPLLQLQQDFPDAARKGLKASIKATAGDGIGDKLAAFVKAQVGARSLEEKAGDDPDAVLSRAQGALNRGELQNSVDLVEKLPVEGQTAMADWLNAAHTRLNAATALGEFSKSVQP